MLSNLLALLFLLKLMKKSLLFAPNFSPSFANIATYHRSPNFSRFDFRMNLKITRLISLTKVSGKYTKRFLVVLLKFLVVLFEKLLKFKF